MKKRFTGSRLTAVAAAGMSVALVGTGIAVATGQGSGSGVQVAPPNAYPSAWSMYASNPQHNPAFTAPLSAQGLWNGYSWNTPEVGAIPLSSSTAYDQSVLGARSAPVKTTQMIGNSVGVTVVNGIVYAESDSGYVYAADAATGKIIWQTQGDNAFMGNPVVENGILVASTGDTGFSFSNVQKFANGKPAVRGMGFAGIYGMNAATGAILWKVPTLGEDMAASAYSNGLVYEGTGDGHVLAINIKTGTTAWTANVGGFDSMSSIAVAGNQIFVGFSHPNFVYALNATTGAINWKQTTPNIANTGMGDNSPSVDPANGIVVQDSVVNQVAPVPPATFPTMDLRVFAMNSTNGTVLWSTQLGSGIAPPAYKAGVTMINNGIVYLGSPITSKYYAINEKTGAIIWTFSIPNAGPAGAGRGSGVIYDNVLWLAGGPYIYALNPATGAVLGKVLGGGRYGIVNPVIIGGTMFLDNSWSWIQAIPLSKIYPGWRPGNTFPGVIGTVHGDDGGTYSFTAQGNVYNNGEPWFGSIPADHIRLSAPVVSLVPDAGGYYLVTSAGNVYNFGKAPWDGSMAGKKLPAPVVSALLGATKGYYLATSAGNVYNFGGAPWYGSMAGKKLSSPIVKITAASNGGYTLTTASGQTYTFG